MLRSEQLTRSLTRPFADLSNLVRSRARVTPPSVPPTSQFYEHFDDPASDERDWQPRNRECSPVLEEPPLDDARESVEMHPSVDIDVDDSFVTAPVGLESPVKSRETWEPSSRARVYRRPDEDDVDRDLLERTERQDSPTTSFASSSRSVRAIDTPDTSFPSTPGEDSREDDCRDDGPSAWLSSTPSKSNVAAADVVAQPHRQSSTPLKMLRYVEVVETCPTPEQAEQEEQRRLAAELDASPLRLRRAGTDEEARRRRSLFKSPALDYGYYGESCVDEVEEENNAEDLDAYLRRAYYARQVGRADYTSPTASHLDLQRSYAPSLVQPDGPSTTASTPRARSRQSTRTDLFPCVSAAELVVASLLSSQSLAAQLSLHETSATLAQASNRLGPYPIYSEPAFPFDSRSRGPPSPLKHTRPLSYSHSLDRPRRGHPTTMSTRRRNPSDHVLVAKASTSTLFTYDLSHLPAPDSPLERPYRVGFLDVLKPSRYLGGGRGTGKFGDRFGAVERKRSNPPAPARPRPHVRWSGAADPIANSVLTAGLDPVDERRPADALVGVRRGGGPRTTTTTTTTTSTGLDGSYSSPMSSSSLSPSSKVKTSWSSRWAKDRGTTSSIVRVSAADGGSPQDAGRERLPVEVRGIEPRSIVAGGGISRSESVRRSLSRSLSTLSETLTGGRRRTRRHEVRCRDVAEARGRGNLNDAWVNVVVA